MTPRLPEWAYAAALAGVPYMTWDRLTAKLEQHPPSTVWREFGQDDDAKAVLDAHLGAGIQVHLRGEPGYPPVLAGDPEAPAVLFAVGDLSVLDRPRVGIVGTRRCTGYGADVARQLGRELAEAGVSIVSGLARGIDGASHEGALAAANGAPPLGVVGSGLDVIYPARHADLWRRVSAVGLLLSEAPLGARPEPWRFPARNRIIALLSHVLVVVESRAAGGSMHTVRAAEQRGVTVMAVPGPIRSRASEGTNRLLSEGCPPVCDVDDVLVALSLETAGMPARRGFGMTPPSPGPPPPAEAGVFEAVGWEATSFEEVLARTGLGPAATAAALARLEEAGWVRGRSGWWERVREP